MCRLKWWFILVVSLFAVAGSFALGWMQTLWANDHIKMAPAILVLYFIYTGFVGWLTYQAERFKQFDLVERHLKSCNLMSISLITLGIIGTSAGLVDLVHAFNSSDPMVVLTGLKNGLMTLGTSTLVGLSTYLAFEIQTTNLEYALD